MARTNWIESRRCWQHLFQITRAEVCLHVGRSISQDGNCIISKQRAEIWTSIRRPLPSLSLGGARLGSPQVCNLATGSFVCCQLCQARGLAAASKAPNCQVLFPLRILWFYQGRPAQLCSCSNQGPTCQPCKLAQVLNLASWPMFFF